MICKFNKLIIYFCSLVMNFRGSIVWEFLRSNLMDRVRFKLNLVFIGD